MDSVTTLTTGSIGVIVPSYNRAHLIIDALESIRGQTHPPQQVILVDDGSTDTTREVIEKWQSSHQLPFVFNYIYQKNKGVGAARNTGIEYACGNHWLAFLDSDDIWSKTHLQSLLTGLESKPDAIAVTNLVMEKNYIDGKLERERLFDHGAFLNKKNEGPEHIYKAFPLSSATLVRRSALVGIRYDTKLKYGEDKLFFAEVSCRGAWLRVAGDPVLYRNYAVTAGAKQLSQNPHQNSRVRFVHLLERKLSKVLKVERNGQIVKGVNMILWKSWYRAAKQLQAMGHNRWALSYFRKASCYDNKLKCYFRMACVLKKQLSCRLKPDSTCRKAQQFS